MLDLMGVKLLDFVVKFGRVLESQIRELALYLGIDVVDDLIASNYLVKQHIFDGQYLIALGEQGIKIYGIKLKKLPAFNILRHEVVVIDLYLKFVKEFSNACIYSDRDLRCTYLDKIPDLLIDNRIAVEVELTTKSTARLLSSICNYINSSAYQHVYYYVIHRSLADKLYNMIHGCRKIQVFLLELSSASALPRIESVDRLQSGYVKHSVWNKLDFDLDGFLLSL